MNASRERAVTLVDRSMHHRAGEGTNTPFSMQDNYTRYEFRWDIRLQYVDDKNAGSDRNEATILIEVLSAGVMLKKNSVNGFANNIQSNRLLNRHQEPTYPASPSHTPRFVIQAACIP